MWANDEAEEALHLQTGRRAAREIDEDVEQTELVPGLCSAVLRDVLSSPFSFIVCFF